MKKKSNVLYLIPFVIVSSISIFFDEDTVLGTMGFVFSMILSLLAPVIESIYLENSLRLFYVCTGVPVLVQLLYAVKFVNSINAPKGSIPFIISWAAYVIFVLFGLLLYLGANLKRIKFEITNKETKQKTVVETNLYYPKAINSMEEIHCYKASTTKITIKVKDYDFKYLGPED